MKKIICLIFLLPLALLGQEVIIDGEGFKTFVLDEGDTAYTMKQYVMVFLKAGPERSQTQEEVQEIQVGHMKHIQWMADEGYIFSAGPFGDDSPFRGILIFNVPSVEEAVKIAEKDPAVKAGRLVIEAHPWWAAKGTVFP